MKESINRFDTALYPLPFYIVSVLKNLSEATKNSVNEIRLRSNMPLSLSRGADTLFVGNYGITLSPDNAITVTDRDISDTVKMLCNNSIYSHTNEINEGYISMRYGHRAGVAGNFSGSSGYDFTSVNIRIARQILGAADELVAYYKGSLLLAGPPSSGKTTLLRDLIRQLSNRGKRISVVDTRGEISAPYLSSFQNDIGINTDVLYGCEKARGIEMALRTLSPDIIAFDEIGTVEELKAVEQCMYGGADVILTAHIGSVREMTSRPVTRRLLEGNILKKIALIDKNHNIEVFSKKELNKCLY